MMIAERAGPGSIARVNPQITAPCLQFRAFSIECHEAFHALQSSLKFQGSLWHWQLSTGRQPGICWAMDICADGGATICSAGSTIRHHVVTRQQMADDLPLGHRRCRNRRLPAVKANEAGLLCTVLRSADSDQCVPQINGLKAQQCIRISHEISHQICMKLLDATI